MILFTLLTVTVSAELLCYWESWNMAKLDDFTHELTEVPLTTSTSNGCSTVIISSNNYRLDIDSSGNPVFGFINEQRTKDSSLYDHDRLLSDIETVQAAGGKVFVSLGGLVFTYRGVINSINQANAFADALALTLDAYKIDGVEYSQFDAESQASIMERMIERLKKKSSCKVMYSVPLLGSFFSPWAQVLESTKSELDLVQNYIYPYFFAQYSLDIILQNLDALSISDPKIVLGIKLGCKDDNGNPAEYLQSAETLAKLVKDNGYYGIAMWSSNSDTRSRTGEVGCSYSTGLDDGTFISSVSAKLI
jgi:hypothetical protein